ncbi:type IV toxin-antitoxin system AbiEi family antitoxin domain-containing protein [Microbacterium sp. 18062]|uniref:type IV toxin-antitoxin system AbiEi family antitoxin domain-containing protein n=1 Tax=Microbacterium sp. 18062 TaxID=2681410 RepID=UPI0013572619|nr:type IV toxin-antitoxin system AbiEi family antitoxin domain-containing protein [Microbacterium sp. 18062]
MRPSSLADLVAQHGGVARSRELLRLGATREDLRRAVCRDALVRLREGVYALPHADPILLEAARHGGEVACTSALRSRGVWILEDVNRPHVWLGAKGRAHRHPGCSCVAHRDAGSSAFGMVGVVQALVQLARCLGDEAFFAAFESAWRRGLLTSASRVEVRAGLPAHQRWLVDIARPSADSGLESILRLRLHRLGIGMESQAAIAGVGFVDFLVDGVLILEVDGKGNHEGPAQRHRDLMRDAVAAAAGYETLRFDYAMVVHDWSTVERAVLTRLGSIRSRRMH